MTMLLHVQPEIRKFQEHLGKNGIVLTTPSEKLDFEADYIDSVFLGTKDGIANVGTLELRNSPIDYLQLVKKQKCVRCDYVMGSRVGMGIHKHTWWKIRFFLTFPIRTRCMRRLAWVQCLYPDRLGSASFEINQRVFYLPVLIVA